MRGEQGSAWAVQQIAEFLSAVSRRPDVDSAIIAGLEHSAEAFEAEIAGLVRNGAVIASVGFGMSGAPDDLLIEVVEQARTRSDIPPIGPCWIASGSLGENSDSWLVLARSGPHPFDRQDQSLLRSMTRVLGMSLDALSTLDEERTLRASLQERQSLLERLSRIQRSISHRAPQQEVLDSITEGAKELLRDDVSALRLIDPDDPTWAIIVSASGLRPEVLHKIRRTPLQEGAGGRAILEHGLVVIEDYEDYPSAIGPLAEQGLCSAMAAPVFVDGEIAGSLVVASFEADRRYSASEREMLLALAEHANLALTDTKTLEAMREAEKSKDMFLAMVSHELKTPLTVIMGVFQTLRRRRGKVPIELADELMATAYERGKDLQRLIDMLLRGAQAQLAGKRELADLRIEIMKALRGFDSTRPIQVGGLPELQVLMDATALRQILGLLVENAISHSQPGSPVRVDVIVDSHVHVLVANRGDLPAELDTKELFEPFQRGANASSPGVGLGLHVASKLAESMDGSLVARSRDGWVTFELTFPLEPPASSEQPPARLSKDSSSS